MSTCRNGALCLVLVVPVVGCDGAGASIGVSATSEDELVGDVPADTLEGSCNDCDGHGHGHRRVVRGVIPGSNDASCLYGTSDADGNVAFGFGSATWDVFADDGTALATITAGDREMLQEDAYPVASGFQIPFERNPGQHAEYLIGTWTPDGTKTGEQSYVFATQFLADIERAPIPGGGVFTSSVRVSPGVTNLSITLHWIGADAQLLGETSFTVPYAGRTGSGGATDTHAHTLALFPGAAGFDAQWFDSDGAARGARFAWPGAEIPQLAPLIGGGFAVRVGADWVGTVASDGTQLNPAPHWLAQRPRTRLVILGHREGYALLQDDGEAAPTRPQAIELRGRHGGWLGLVVAFPPRGKFRGQRTRIGRDGTIVQLFTERNAGATQCSYRFWPHALR